MKRHMVSAQTTIGAANVKRSRRSQNDMAPEVTDATQMAHKQAQKTVVVKE
jgi:hypothetical protein